ncbi:Platelet-activating factor acetylhydrolase 2, cytoplasmic [Seminavis robusta]|uniref:1-alkyl-2-acetylglycerophosphocholine esterase n=1 Tax=Seminavis robusta TaxID=568900 RepID=A0A9N8EB39_9STRA|nr:Platelet-activating factor acetylhydrolase 2, cytoplasmic [Seminavis robusta]|eukprot:Sro826_g207760.1 Platelet-activating factor acetylhydrolase 2, cytoplasmic (403) ;mRNA; r:43124-44332
MLATSLLKRVLWVLRFPSFAPESGNYRVGAIQTRLPDSIACQIHYPANTTPLQPKQQDFTPYMRPQAVDGIADYSRTPASLLQFLAYRQHPCAVNAEPLQGRFPVVLFSHGLGGCMEMYTQLCQQVASHGFIVVAMEHEEGSGAYAETPLGQPILYSRPDDSPYSRQKVLNFRRPFLKQRVEETTRVLEILLNKNKNATIPPHVQKILQVADTSRGIAFLGHSFGAASLMLATRQYLDSKQQQQQQARMIPNSLSVLDPWCFSLEDDVLNQGMPTEIPTLSILSENWLTNPEVKQVDQFLQHCNTLSSWFIPKSAHASFSDAVSWLPRVVGRKLYLCHKQEQKHKTVPTAAKACVDHIQSALLAAGDNNNYQPPQASEFLQEYKTPQILRKVPSKVVANTAN